MAWKYAEFVVKAPWFAPAGSGGERGPNILQTRCDWPVLERYQGEQDFHSDTSLPRDRLELLSYMEAHGWEVVSVAFDDWTALLIIARKKVYGTMEVNRDI